MAKAEVAIHGGSRIFSVWPLLCNGGAGMVFGPIYFLDKTTALNSTRPR
jgi:hypothetical protein